MDFISYKRREKKDTNATELGSMSHTTLLEPESFNDRYLVSDLKEIGGNLGKFLEVYAQTNDVNAAYINSGYKLALNTVKEYLTKPENKEYVSMLRKSMGKIIVSPDDMTKLTKMETNIRKHKLASKLIFTAPSNISDSYEAHNELTIKWRYPKTQLIVNSMLDRLIVSDQHKKIIIVDYKTTGKSIHDFKPSYRKYKYYWQIYLYLLAVRSWLAAQGKDHKEYDFEFKIVVAQTTGWNQCRVWTPHYEDLKLAQNEIKEMLPDLIFHLECDEWEHETDYYRGDGSSILRIS